jgi:hypothetical protein
MLQCYQGKRLFQVFVGQSCSDHRNLQLFYHPYGAEFHRVQGTLRLVLLQ